MFKNAFYHTYMHEKTKCMHLMDGGGACGYKLWSISLHSLHPRLQTLTPSDSKQMAEHQLLSPAN